MQSKSFNDMLISQYCELYSYKYLVEMKSLLALPLINSCWNRRRFFSSIAGYWHGLFSAYRPPADQH